SPGVRAETLTLCQGEKLTQIANPLPALKMGQAVIQQEPGHDLVGRISLEYPCGEDSIPPFNQYSFPLWESLGQPRIVGEEDPHGGHLALIWRDAATRYALCLPYENGRPIKLEITDGRGSQGSAQREASAATLAASERRQRLQSGQPLQTVKRLLDQYELG